MLRPGLRVTVSLRPPDEGFARRYVYTFTYRRHRVAVPFDQTRIALERAGAPDPCALLAYAVQRARNIANWGPRLRPTPEWARVVQGLHALFGEDYDQVVYGAPRDEPVVEWCRGVKEL